MIASYLDCSTAYVTESEAAGLDAGAHAWIVRDHDEYGWWVHVPAEPMPDWDDLGYDFGLFEAEYQNVGALIRYAHEMGCNWVLIDRDGPQDLPDEFGLFDW